MRAIWCLTFATHQCAGTRPSHSTPESFSCGAFRTPRNTAEPITACRFSLSKSRDRSLLAISAPMATVLRSRKSAMARCSEIQGRWSLMFRRSPHISRHCAGRIPYARRRYSSNVRLRAKKKMQEPWHNPGPLKSKHFVVRTDEAGQRRHRH